MNIQHRQPISYLKPRPDFKVPPLTPQNVSRQIFNPSWKRWMVIGHLVDRYGWTAGAELGLWQGRTMNALLAGFPKLTMVGVDLWEPQPGNPGPEGYERWPHHQHERTCRLHAARHGDRAIIIKDYTTKAATKVADESLDFVFIDADHSEEGCTADIEAWLPKIKPTGWILGHDINWPGVLASVERLVPGYLRGPDVVWMRPVNPQMGWEAEFKN